VRDCYTLGEVARILGRKPAQVVYPLVTHKIAEPESRIAGKRLFRTEDVSRLARHFRVSPNWNALKPAAVDVDADPPAHLSLKPPYDVHQVSESGCEVRDCDGEIFAWASDRGHALVIAGLLEAAARG
jgi:hypothetical protein